MSVLKKILEKNPKDVTPSEILLIDKLLEEITLQYENTKKKNKDD